MQSVPYPKLAPRPLKPALLGMEGFSKRQIEAHFAMYQRHVAKLNEVHELLLRLDRGAGEAAYGRLHELKIELSFALNAVKLHEAYFENLGGGGGEPAGKTRALLERDFGSAEGWVADFRASAMGARAWVILAYDRDDARLHNFVADAHNGNGIWNAVPVLVLDCEEHAYAVDYGAGTAAYVAAFLRNVDWAVVDRRLSVLGK